MAYIILIYLLLMAGVGHTTQEQMGYETSYVRTGTVSDACKVQSSRYFPAEFAGQCGEQTRQQWGQAKRDGTSVR